MPRRPGGGRPLPRRARRTGAGRRRSGDQAGAGPVRRGRARRPADHLGRLRRQRHRGAPRQRTRPGRRTGGGGGGLRLLAGRRRRGRGTAALRRRRLRGGRWRGTALQRAGHGALLLAGPAVAQQDHPLRRRGRRLHSGRRLRALPAQAPDGRPPRRRPGVRRAPRGRRVQRREVADRPRRRRPGAGRTAGLRPGRLRPGRGGLPGGPRHRHPPGRPRGGRRRRTGLRHGTAYGTAGHRIRQVLPRPHLRGGRGGRTAAHTPGVAAGHPAAQRQPARTQPRPRPGRRPRAGGHRSRALGGGGGGRGRPPPPPPPPAPPSRRGRPRGGGRGARRPPRAGSRGRS